MGRTIAFLGLALLAGCDEAKFAKVHLTVNNLNAEPVRVHVQLYEAYGMDWDDLTYELAPGGSTTTELHGFRGLEVTIRRVSDGEKLFSEFWDIDELRALKGQLTIDVQP